MIILKKKVRGLSQHGLARFAARAAAAAGLRGSVNILITDNRELRLLNRRFRHKDQPTDVLSFPADSSLIPGPSGDVAISAELAAASAKRFGHSPADEVKILVLHGILHLAGYDHERDNGIMARKEARLRQALKLRVGLIERHPASGTAAASKGKRSRQEQP